MQDILKQRVHESGRIEYLVDWVGNWEPTWEPAECLFHCQDKVTRFKSRSGPTSPKRGQGRKRGRRGV